MKNNFVYMSLHEETKDDEDIRRMHHSFDNELCIRDFY